MAKNTGKNDPSGVGYTSLTSVKSWNITMITIIRNPAGERAVIASMSGFRKLLDLRYDHLLNRFRRWEVESEIPLPHEIAGSARAVRAVVEQVGAIYPAPDGRLAAVDGKGRVVHVGGVGRLATALSSSQVRVRGRLCGLKRLDGLWIVHYPKWVVP